MVGAGGHLLLHDANSSTPTTTVHPPPVECRGEKVAGLRWADQGLVLDGLHDPGSGFALLIENKEWKHFVNASDAYGLRYAIIVNLVLKSLQLS